MTTRFPSGLWAIVLIASVLLNGVILGAVAAAALGGAHIGRPRADFVGPPIPPFAEGASGALREEVAEHLRRGARETRPLLREASEANEAAMAALVADPFDPDAARAALARAAAARAALEARAQEITIVIFSELPPDARRDLVRMRMMQRGDEFMLGRSRAGQLIRPGGRLAREQVDE